MSTIVYVYGATIWMGLGVCMGIGNIGNEQASD